MPHPVPRRSAPRVHAHLGLVSLAASAPILLPAGAARAAGGTVCTYATVPAGRTSVVEVTG
ncbi:hypothetical protein [Kitasatospora purpeofusca]|uniref:hypothetical protein n=1 Tax=Kitasatospora purpeofusca TaxID=67352 RepID=UPI003862D4D0|nr:hypothetical protein OIP63_37125 [Kitasatospora purpeofusca]